MSDSEIKEAKYHIKLKAQWQPNVIRSHVLNLVGDSLLTMKKKMLRAYRLSKEEPSNFLFSFKFFGNTFFLNNEEDFFFFVSQYIQSESEDPLLIDISRVRLSKKTLLALDSKKHMDNHPSDPLHDDKYEVLCAFCKVSSKNREVIEDLGPFYGPFRAEGQDFHAHEKCAIWNPAVYLDMDNKMKNIGKEIKRARECRCSYCGVWGAGLGCFLKSCKRTYHFKCSLQEDLDCVLDYDNFTLYCPEHKKEAPTMQQERNLEYEMIFCKVCGSGEDEEKMLICERCLQGCHIYCLEEKVEEIPEEEWFCSSCLNNDKSNEEENGI